MPNLNVASFACGLLLLTLPLAAQTDTPKPANVEGVVKDSLSGAAIPRAHIALGKYTAIASAEGKFAISDIAPGGYKLAAEHPEYVMSHMQPIRLTLSAGEAKPDVEIALVPTGGIAGRVTDADGEPVEAAQVEVEDGARTVSSARTDENGQFRVGGLAPGRYRVLASRSGVRGERPEIRTDGTVERHDAATYHPAAVAPNAAGSVAVQPGIDTVGVDIQLVRVPFVRVSGRVLGLPRGRRGADVTAWRGTGGVDNVHADETGAFEMWRLDPGKYRLSAESTAANGEYLQTAEVEIEVGDSNIDDIELHLIPPSNISAHIEYEDDTAKQIADHDRPSARAEVLVNFFQTDVANSGLGVAQVGSDGRFRIGMMAPDRYWFGVADNRLYVKSMRLGSMPIGGAILDLRDGSGGADLTLVVSAANGVVTGSVQDERGGAAGAVVVLVEASGKTGFTERHAVVSADGVYTFPNLPPGSYMLVATSEENPTVARNRILGYENQEETVTVGDGERVTKDLTRRTPE